MKSAYKREIVCALHDVGFAVGHIAFFTGYDVVTIKKCLNDKYKKSTIARKKVLTRRAIGPIFKPLKRGNQARPKGRIKMIHYIQNRKTRKFIGQDGCVVSNFQDAKLFNSLKAANNAIHRLNLPVEWQVWEDDDAN